SVARAGHIPSIDFTANYYLKRTGILQDSRWDLGVQFSLPLFQGDAIQAQVEEAAQGTKVRELELARARRQAEREIRTLYAAVKRGETQFRLLETAAKE